MGGWRGWIWPGTPTGAGSWCGVVLPWASWKVWGRCRKPFSARTSCKGVWKVGIVEWTSGAYPMLVVGAGDDSRCRWHPGASPKDTWASFELPQMDEWGTQHWQLLSGPTSTSSSLPKRFPLAAPNLRFPCWDLWWGTTKEDHGLHPGFTMLGHDRANLPTPGQPHLLAAVCPGIM